MISILGNSVSVESFLMVFIAVLLIGYFVYKEWPEFKKRVSAGAKKEAEDESEDKTIVGRLNRVEKRLDDVSDMLSRDYIRLNTIEKLSRDSAGAINESLEERCIIMEALLACLVGLREVGADGPTAKAIQMINEYLNRQAHINQAVMHDAAAPKVNPNV